MNSLAFDVQKLNQMIQQRQIFDALERYYGPEVTMVEGGGGEATVGFEANVERERAFFSGITKWDAKLVSSAVDENSGTALNEWTIDFDHAQYGTSTLRQVAVQRWRDGRIVHETFYKL